MPWGAVERQPWLFLPAGPGRDPRPARPDTLVFDLPRHIEQPRDRTGRKLPASFAPVVMTRTFRRRSAHCLRPHRGLFRQLPVGVQPDVICAAKAITNGYFPFGAVRIAKDVVQAFASDATKRLPVTDNAAARRAMLQIAPTGLVRRLPRIGAVVFKPTLAEVLAILSVHAKLEGLAAGPAARRLSPPGRWRRRRRWRPARTISRGWARPSRPPITGSTGASMPPWPRPRARAAARDRPAPQRRWACRPGLARPHHRRPGPGCEIMPGIGSRSGLPDMALSWGAEASRPGWERGLHMVTASRRPGRPARRHRRAAGV